jgi:hypothetical protein
MSFPFGHGEKGEVQEQACLQHGEVARRGNANRIVRSKTRPCTRLWLARRKGGVIVRSPMGLGDENPLRCQWMLRTSVVFAIIARRKSRAAFIVVCSGAECPQAMERIPDLVEQSRLQTQAVFAFSAQHPKS